MRRGVVLAVLMALGAASIGLTAMQAPAQAPKVIDIEKLRDNFYVLTSSSPGDRATFSGGNVAVFLTDAGVVLVDTKLAGWGQVMLEKIKSVTSKPVTTIINTHTHGDHTGNNELFGENVEAVVHENTKTNMARMEAFAGEKAKFLPKKTYKDRLSVGKGRDQVDLYYFGAGHTDGDTFVVFPALRIMHTGDMFAWKDAPFIDRKNGGSGVAFPDTLAKALATVKNVDTIVPGHIAMATWKDLDEFQRFNRDLLAAVREAARGGRSAEEAVTAAKAVAAKYPGYQTQRVKAAVEAIYSEIKP